MTAIFFNIITAMFVNCDKLIRHQQTKNGRDLTRFLILFGAYGSVILSIIYSTCLWITNFNTILHYINLAFFPVIFVLGFSLWFTNMGLKNTPN